MIRFEGVGKTYPGGLEVLRGLTLTVPEGELLALVGESGSGKTTMLKCINRLVDPTVGRILVHGKPHDAADPVMLRRTIGVVFQRFALFPHMTVGENVAVVPRLLGWDDAKVTRRVDELLELVGLTPERYRARFPAALSGGQQQRVGVARAIAARPRILLMDEPLGALDPRTREGLGRECRRLHERLGLTTVMVTHDMTEAMLLADRIAVLHCGELLQVGSPLELFERPVHERVAELIRWPRRQAQQLSFLLEDRKPSTAPS